MFSLMQPGHRPVEEPRPSAPAPSPPALPLAPSRMETAEDTRGDWPGDVHLPDEKEDDAC
jgi:hypothetical protein